jgi:hypothetical protein
MTLSRDQALEILWKNWTAPNAPQPVREFCSTL